MKEKKDIFNGKIKREYFSYILVSMIFFVLLFVGTGALCIYASIWGMTVNPLSERLIIGSFGVIAFILAFVYLFLEMLVIRRFPEYKKLRRILFNSDCYFTESDSKEYYGRRRHRAAFELVTSFLEAEKGIGDSKPIQYKIYSALVALMIVLELVILIVIPLLFANSVMPSKKLAGVIVLFCIPCAFICLALAIFFFVRAFKVALMSPFEKDKWIYELNASLIDVSIRQNNKKRKFWYDVEQLEQIENLVSSASNNAELKLVTKRNKLVSFTVIDIYNHRVIFTGLFK